MENTPANIVRPCTSHPSLVYILDGKNIKVASTYDGFGNFGEHNYWKLMCAMNDAEYDPAADIKNLQRRADIKRYPVIVEKLESFLDDSMKLYLFDHPPVLRGHRSEKVANVMCMPCKMHLPAFHADIDGALKTVSELNDKIVAKIAEFAPKPAPAAPKAKPAPRRSTGGAGAAPFSDIGPVEICLAYLNEAETALLNLKDKLASMRSATSRPPPAKRPRRDAAERVANQDYEDADDVSDDAEGQEEEYEEEAV
jgi:hypothetical protein